MNIDCPKCHKNMELDCDDLSDYACDAETVECTNDECQEQFKVGWYATAELR